MAIKLKTTISCGKSTISCNLSIGRDRPGEHIRARTLLVDGLAHVEISVIVYIQRVVGLEQCGKTGNVA